VKLLHIAVIYLLKVCILPLILENFTQCYFHLPGNGYRNEFD